MTISHNNLLTSALIEFGLSDKEARIYLSLLESDTQTIQEVAKNAGVNRSSTYVILESLKRKGLVFSIEGKMKYIAASPDILKKQIEDASIKTKTIKEKINNILPDLKALHRDTKHKPIVRVYQGKTGIETFYESLLSAKMGTIMRAFSQPNVLQNLGDGYFMKLASRRVGLGIHLKAIYPQNVKQTFDFSDSAAKKVLAEFRFLPNKTQTFSSDFRIYDDKIALTSEKDEFGIIIENKDIAEAVKFIFDLAWENAEKYDSKEKRGKK